MAKAYIFYNPLAGNNQCEKTAKKLDAIIEEEHVFCDMTKSETYEKDLFSLQPDDCIILCGGDGTLNRFVNITEGADLKNEILYFPSGTGNDFALDLGKHFADKPFPITKYLKNLPSVEVNGRKYRFINGIGYGIDGYCCEVGDEMKKTSDKPVNYTSIAINGLLFHYKPTDAVITVDGEKYTYKKVWLAPTMNGRFYGGGMMPAPGQDRENNENLSVMVFHGTGKLRTLMIFPSIFKGEHVKHKKAVEVLRGKEIRVEFSEPRALQIDGETILNVKKYTAYSPAAQAAKTVTEDVAAAN